MDRRAGDQTQQCHRENTLCHDGPKDQYRLPGLHAHPPKHAISPMRMFSTKLRQSYGWAAGIEKTPLGSGCTVLFWRNMCQVSARFSVTDPGQER